MPAIPRGWTFTSFVGGGGNPTIIIPAGVGNVRHFLTLSEMTIFDNPAAPAQIAIDVLDGVTSLGVLMLLTLPGLAVLEVDRDSWSGIYASSPGASMTIRSTAGALPGNVGGLLRVQGYDQ